MVQIGRPQEKMFLIEQVGGQEMLSSRLGQQHIPSFGNMQSSMNDSTAGFSMIQQQLSTTVGFGVVDQVKELNNLALNSQNNVVVMQLIQKQQQHVQQQQQQLQIALAQKKDRGQLQGAQLVSGQNLDMSLPNLVGTQVAPNENRGMPNTILSLVNNSSSLGNIALGSGKSKHMSTMEYGLDVSDSSASDVIGRMHTVEY